MPGNFVSASWAHQVADEAIMQVTDTPLALRHVVVKYICFSVSYRAFLMFVASIR